VDTKQYLAIISHYESCLSKYGDTHKGVDWPNQADADTRYQVMLDLIRRPSNGIISLLDFGCGASHLYEYIERNKSQSALLASQLKYNGLDLSEKFVALSKKKFPNNRYYHLDILDDQVSLPEFDYIVMTGVFTEKCDLSFDDMLSYCQAVLIRAFRKVRIGMAFNVMSKQVDWERQDLFHLPFELLASFITNHLSRNFVFRHDYGLYEYTAYVYRDLVRNAGQKFDECVAG
jgi:SAM-dependent methyltransferase